MEFQLNGINADLPDLDIEVLVLTSDISICVKHSSVVFVQRL